MNNASVETRQQRRFKARQEAKQIHPQKGAFKRAMAMFKEIATVREANMLLGPVTLQLALMQLMGLIGPYKSRGHGRGDISPSYNLAAQRSRYRPHQGARECERRRVGGFAFRRYMAQRAGAGL